MAQLFNPSFAALHLTAQFVDELCSAIPMLLGNSIALKAELAVYLVSARGHPGLDESDVHSFTDGVLKFWRDNGNKMKAWSDAARIVFAIPPNSAASERVFALLADMFNKKMNSCLSDYIQAALMLRYNKRSVG